MQRAKGHDIMKIRYKEPKKLKIENKKLLEKMIKIIEHYGREGYKLTLRQLYYSLVAQIIIKNDKHEYAKISRMLKDARMSGQVDWDIIEDRIRVPQMHIQFNSTDELLEVAINSYRRDRWKGQDEYIEVWVEKDALAGVLEPITEQYHVHLLVNRGYSSTSAMHDSALRIKEEQENKKCTILYFGDHDPSGEDMVRDLEDRLKEFGCEVMVDKIALTMSQVKKYHLPPNPIKMTDTRSIGYSFKHGDESWELDALKPEILRQLVVNNIEYHLNREKYDPIVELEERDKKALRRFAKKFQAKKKKAKKRRGKK